MTQHNFEKGVYTKGKSKSNADRYTLKTNRIRYQRPAPALQTKQILKGNGQLIAKQKLINAWVDPDVMTPHLPKSIVFQSDNTSDISPFNMSDGSCTSSYLPCQ